jgi:hypothetical protein
MNVHNTRAPVVGPLFYDSGLSIPEAVKVLETPIKASVMASNNWPVETHILLSLTDVVSFVSSNFYTSGKSLSYNIEAALALHYSPSAWNFTNIMNGPLNNEANKLNLDGFSWKQLRDAGADDAALVSDLAANINFVTVASGSFTSDSQFVSQYGVPYVNALEIAKNLKKEPDSAKGRITPNGKWTIAALALNLNYSSRQKKGLFNNNPVLASQVLSNDAFISLKWTPEELIPLMPRLELADLLTATELISREFDSHFTATSNSSFIRMIYDNNTIRSTLVKTKYPTLSDSEANAIAGLTVYSDIVDAVASRNL